MERISIAFPTMWHLVPGSAHAAAEGFVGYGRLSGRWYCFLPERGLVLVPGAAFSHPRG